MLSAALVCTSLSLSGQEVKTEPHNYTSAISESSVGGLTLLQEVGGPFSAPVLLEGDDLVVQGLLFILDGSDPLITDVNSIFDEDNDVVLEYDDVLGCINVENPRSGKLIVVNSNGQTVASILLEAGTASTDVSSLTPGLYAAGFTSSNKINKSIKFIVK